MPWPRPAASPAEPPWWSPWCWRSASAAPWMWSGPIAAHQCQTSARPWCYSSLHWILPPKVRQQLRWTGHLENKNANVVVPLPTTTEIKGTIKEAKTKMLTAPVNCFNTEKNQPYMNLSLEGYCPSSKPDKLCPLSEHGNIWPFTAFALKLRTCTRCTKNTLHALENID